MKIALGVSLWAALAWLSSNANAGSETKLEDIVKQTLAILDRLTTTLNTIRDEDTAKTAIPELRKSAAQFLALKKKADHVPPPSKLEKERLAKLYKVKLEDARKKLLTEVGRVNEVAGGREALQEINAVLDKEKKPKEKGADK